MINRRRTYGELSPKDIIMTVESNPEVLAICYAQGWAKHSEYMTAREAAKVKTFGTAFQNSNITHFNELLYFTGTGTYLSQNSTFLGCSSLTEITIPGNITRFYASDFQGCTALKKVNVINLDNYLNNMYTNLQGVPTYPGGADLYYNGLLVEEVTFTKNVVRYCLRNCKSIKRIIINEGVTTLNDLCFYGCSNVTSITWPSSLVTLSGGRHFSETAITSIVIPEGVTTISASCFRDCSLLSSVTIPSTITTINELAFFGVATNGGVYISNLDNWCRINFNSTNLNTTNPTTNLKHLYLNNVEVTSVTVPNDVKSLKFTFSYLTNLTSVTLPEGLTTIGRGTFDHCTNLTGFTIPSTVTNIDTYAFRSCTNITSITLPSGLTNIGQEAFNGDNKIQSSITIPSTCTNIGISAFSGCNLISSITVLGAGTTIYEGTFYNCKTIPLMILPEGVTTVTNLWIWECRDLTYLELPSTITSITKLGLASYHNPKPTKCNIVIRATTPPEAPYSNYLSSYLNKLYVPDASVDAYKTAWPAFASYIHAMSELPE